MEKDFSGCGLAVSDGELNDWVEMIEEYPVVICQALTTAVLRELLRAHIASSSHGRGFNNTELSAAVIGQTNGTLSIKVENLESKPKVELVILVCT